MRRICVYCGSNMGVRRAYADAAEELADVLHRLVQPRLVRIDDRLE